MDELLNYFQGSKDPLDDVLKKGENNPLVCKIKYAINAIAQYRGINKIVIKGVTIGFPLSITDRFDSDTYEIASEFFPAFKSTGRMTIRIARSKWTYSAGYYGNPFPTALSNASNYDELLNKYENGIIDNAKQIRETIVENILKAFEFLGTSSIKIFDQSGFLGETGVTGTPVSASVNVSSSNESLRAKNFGKSPLNEKLALEYTQKLKIMPPVVNAINSRIKSNLLSETIVTNVSLGAGASLSVNGVGANASFKLNRKLEIQVTFYDKSEL